jgi:hypothetical protein
MALSDVYMALKTGVVDGTKNPASNFLTRQIYKVQKFMTPSNHGYLGYVVIVKERFWLDPSSDVRRVVRESLAKATAFANDIAKSDNENALQQIRTIGKHRSFNWMMVREPAGRNPVQSPTVKSGSVRALRYWTACTRRPRLKRWDERTE